MVNCGYCNKELKRVVFCSNSHKVIYHRRATKFLENKLKNLEKLKDLSPLKDIKKIRTVLKKADTFKLCEHGAMPGLCKFFKCRK